MSTETRDDLDMEYVLELAHAFDTELKNHAVQNPTIVYEDSNPLCGDKFKISLRYDDDGQIEDIGVVGRGCAISRAAAYTVAEKLRELSIPEVGKLTRDEIIDELGIEINSAVRLKCANLALRTVKKGLVLAGHPEVGTSDDDDWHQ